MEKIQFLCGILYQILGFRYELIIDKLNVPLTGLWRFFRLFEENRFSEKNLMLDKYYFYINFGLKSNLKIFKFDKIFNTDYNPIERKNFPKIDVINIYNHNILKQLYEAKIDERAFFFLRYQNSFKLNLTKKYFRNSKNMQVLLIGQNLISKKTKLIISANNICLEFDLVQPKDTIINNYNIESLTKYNELCIHFQKHGK